MQLKTERSQVRTVAARWRQQYGDSKRGIYDQLRGLDKETATAADVAAIIGNTSWVEPDTCDECGAESYDAVTLGEPPNWESATATICRDCLVKALALLSAPPKEAKE